MGLASGEQHRQFFDQEVVLSQYEELLQRFAPPEKK
jgi:hypothetical protein